MATPPKHDTQTISIVILDFNGGSHVYRNPELGMNIPVRIAPSGISADRARMLTEMLNGDCADSHVRFEFRATSTEGKSSVRIGRTSDFDKYGAFLGLAEGIGSGDAFVLLDDSANDAELVDVIRHEAGHILGTLDHGGAGLARYAWQHTTTIYNGISSGYWQRYLKSKTTATQKYSYVSPPSDLDGVTLQYHSEGTEITTVYDTYDSEFLERPDTNYSNPTYTTELYRTVSGRSLSSLSIYGGSADNCSVSGDVGVSFEYDHDEVGVYGSSSDYVRYSNYQYHFGSASGCLIGGKLFVDGGCVARQCEAASIIVKGSRLEQSYDSTIAPDSHNRDDSCTFSYVRAQVENCNVSGGNLIVGLGGEARNIIVKSGGAVIGNDISINTWYNKNIDGVGFPAYDEAGRAELKTELENYGAAKVTNLIVEGGSVTVNYGGELYGADINGSLTFSEGAVLGGVITCKSVMLWEDVVPQTNINIKIDLHDYAVPNYTEEIKDEQGRVVKVIDYFANYTTKIYSYTYFSDGTQKVSTTTGTFNNNDGRFDMTNWKYTFAAPIGQLEYASALPYILVDLGGTEKDFDEGWLGFYYPTSNSELELNISGDKRKWEEQWGPINGAGSPIGYLGSIAYNAALYGEAADVLWLEFGEDPEVDYTIDLASEMAGASKDLTVTYAVSGAETLTDAKIQGATLVVKGGSDVDNANLKIQATDSDKREHECDLELLVVPESIPIIGKEGTKKYAAMLKKAQKNHITTEINDILPYNIHTKLFGMSFDLTNMGISLKVNWTEPSMTLKLQGKMEWAIGKGTAGTGKQLKLVIDLSGDNYISITCRGKNSYSWDLVGELKVPDFKIGKFEFSNMALKVNKEQASFSVSTYVKLPWIKYSFGGSIGIVDGYLDSMSIGADGLNVPLGTSGLFLQKIEGGISGIATELNLSFDGTLGLTAGPKFSVEFVDWLGIDDGEYSLCELTLSGSLSTAGDLKGSAVITILGGLATGSGSASLEGGAITVTGSFTFLNGCISIEGKLNATSGGITIDGKGTATVPRERIFGPLAGFGMSANVSAVVKQDARDSYVMAWQKVSIFGNDYTIGFKSTFEGDVTLLGSTDLLKEEKRNLRLLKGGTVQSFSVGDGMRGATPSASEKYIVSEAGVTFFQVSFSVTADSPYASITFDGVEYTQASIAAGQHENMQIVNELSGVNSVTIAVNNASLGEWTINAYGNEKAIFAAYTFADAVTKPVISTVEVGEGKRTATINYSLGDLSATENATISIFRSDSGSTEFTGAKIGELSVTEATGVFEYAPDDDLPGGSYSFYLMVTSDKLAPSYSDMSAACEFITVDTEAPDQIQIISTEWKSSGTVVTWEVPYDDHGVSGYRIRYAVGDEDMAEFDVKTNTFTFDKVPNGTYDFQVAAYDEAGNLSAWSEQQSCLVLTVANAKYKDITLTNGLELAEYESAVNITGGGFAVTAAANSLISGSVLADAGISGIVEDTSFNGTVNLYDGAQGYGLTVNGELTIGGAQPEPEIDITKVEILPDEGEGDGELGGEGNGDESPVETPALAEAAEELKKGAFADGITVRDGGVLVIEADSEVRNITVEAGGSLALKDDAVYDQVSIAYGAGLSFVGGNSSIYRLTGDIWTAGTLGTYRTISGGGHKIHFEQYKQTDEISNPDTSYARDDVAFLSDMDKLAGKVLDIVIDSNIYAWFRIADKAQYFDGTITVTDHDSGGYAEVGFDQYTLVGNALCKLQKTKDALYLETVRAEIGAPTVTVDNAESDQYDSVAISITPAEHSGASFLYTYRYADNPDMTDAIVVENNWSYYGPGSFTINKDELVDKRTYYVQACLKNNFDVMSPWSDTASFTVTDIIRPAAPTLTVSNATDKNSASIYLKATGVDDSNYTVREYRFRYADNPEMKNAVVITTGQRHINYASIDKANIEDGKDYYVQAGVKQLNDWSYWSDMVVFNTQGWDYENITIGPEPDGDFNYFTLGGKRAKDVTVIDGGYFYGGTGEVDGLTIEAGGFFRDDGATVTNAVMNGGEYWLSEGSVTDIVVNGGEFTVRNGVLNGATIGVNATMDLSSHYMPTISGTILIQGQFTIYYLHQVISTNAEFVFDVGAHEANKDKSFVDYIYALGGTSKFTAKLDETPEIGEYRITSLYQVPEGGVNISLKANDGTDLGTMRIGDAPILYNGLYYSLIDQKNVAYLHVSDNQDPPFIGAVKLSKNGTVYDSHSSYVDISVSISDECDYVLVGDGGQLYAVTVGNGGKVDLGGDVFGATIENGGQLTIKVGGRALSNIITVKDGGNVTIEGGKVDLGAAFHLAGGTITVNGALQGWEDDSGNEWGATRHWFVYDLDKLTAVPSGAMISDYEMLTQCNPEFTAYMSADQKNVSYKLLGNASGFDRYVSLNVEGHDYQEYLRIGQECSIGDSYYSLAVVDNVLTLTVSSTRPVHAPSVWADVTEPTTGSVTVTASFDETAKTKEYSLDGVTWKTYKKAIKVTENGTIYFRGKDSKGNTSPVVSYEVTNIEKSGPGPEPGPDPDLPADDGTANGWLYDKTKGVNEELRDSYGTTLEDGVSEVALDEDGTVSREISGVTYSNFVGQGDEADFSKVVLDHGARLSFALEATDAVKFIVYSLVEGTGKKAGTYTMKALQTTAFKPAKGAESAQKNTKQLSLDPGEYYISMQSTNAKKGGSAFYNVSINEDGTNGSVFYPQGNNEDDWTDMKTEGAGSAMLDDLGMVTPETTDLIDDWVGFGDTVDYKCFMLEHAAELDFAFGAPDGSVKFSVCKLKETTKKGVTTYSLINIKTATIKANQASARLNDLRLKAGEYFIKAEYTNAKKGNGTDYTVSISDSRFYSDGDNGDNNWLYDKKTKEVNVSVMDGFVSEIDTDHIGELLIDEPDTVLYDGIAGYEFHNFVGFGDEADYAKISVAHPGTATFKVTATDAAKLVVYQLTYNKNGEVSGTKAIQTVTLKKNAAGLFETPTNTKACNFKQPGDYYISVQATAKKKETTYYNVSLVSTDIAAPLLVNQSAQDMCALTEQETDSLADSLVISDSLSLGQYDTDALAGTYLDSVQDKLFSESGNGLLASL